MSGRGVLLILALLLLGASAIFFGRAWLLTQTAPAPQPVAEAPKISAAAAAIAPSDRPIPCPHVFDADPAPATCISLRSGRRHA